MKFDEEGKLSCTCNMVSTRGFPCRHIWKVNCHLDKSDLTLIPIVSRWTINYGSHLLKALAVYKEIETAKYEESKENYPTKTEETLNLQMSTIPNEKKKVRMPERKSKKRKENPVEVDERDSQKYVRTRSQATLVLQKMNTNF